MKRIFLISASIFLTAFLNLYSQDLDQVISDHFNASGKEKAVKIDNQVMTGKTIISAMGLEMPFVISMQRPNKIRVESSFQGTKVIQTYNGEKGWMLAPMMGSIEPKELSGPELKLLKSQGDMDGPLWEYKEKGNSVELIGEENVKDSPAWHIKVTSAEGDVIHQYIDKKTKLVTKVATTQPIGGAETEIENLLGDYKIIKGIAVPHSITTRMNGQTVSMVTVETVNFNEKIDPSIFGKPSL